MGMTNPGKIPFLRITLPFAGGIALYEKLSYAAPPLWLWVLAGICLIVFSLLVLRWIPLPPWRLRWAGGLPAVVGLFIAGYLWFAVSDAQCESARTWLQNHPGGEEVVALVLLEDPQRKTRSYGINCALLMAATDSTDVHFRIPVQVMAYFPHDTAVALLGTGDTLLATGAFRADQGPGNPSSFNFNRYLRRRGIHHTVWVCADCWLKTGDGNPPPVQQYAAEVRRNIIAKVHASDLKDENKGLALALMIGVKDDLDPDVNRSFAAAGAVHVLCVSGLHVGIIYMMVGLLLGPVRKIRRYGNILVFLMGSLAIWSYALVTGLPPSVNRASLMFTFILASGLSHRHRVPMNSVLASAFILLVNDPAVLFHAGFQLSYLAVTGIITLLPTLSKLWNPQNRWLVKLRDLMGVSVAAQLFTFPVAVALFNIFPNYFLLTNILVIPITGVVMYTGVAFLLINIELLSPVVAFAFDTLLTMMRYMVGFVDALPGSLSQNIVLPKLQLWMCLVAVLALMLSLKGEGRRFLLLTLLALTVVASDGVRQSFRRKAVSQVVVYQARKGCVVDVIEKQTRVTVQAAVAMRAEDVSFATSGHRLKQGVADKLESSRFQTIELPEEAVISVTSGQWKLLFCNAPPVLQTDTTEFHLAVIGPKLKPENVVFERVTALNWVLDGRMPLWKAEQWQKIADKERIALWNVTLRGALVINEPPATLEKMRAKKL